MSSMTSCRFLEKNSKAPPPQNWWKYQSELLKRPRVKHWFHGRDGSRQRQRNERSAFHRAKRLDYKEVRNKWKPHLPKYCGICTEAKSNTARIVFEHQHESTLCMRMQQDLDGHGMMRCKHCIDNLHYAKVARRYPILVTSSFLNGWRTPKYAGDDWHMESISIPGANIENLMMAFSAEYGQINLPVDIVLVAGLNNFERETVEEMMKKYRAFKQLVHNREDGSTFGVSTLPFAPKLTDLKPREPVEEGGWVTGPLGTKMINLNEAIKHLNRQPMWTKKTLSSSKEEIIRRSVAKVTAPSFHTWGVDRAKSIDHGYVSGYRYYDWREREKGNMLHFNDRVRARAGKTVIRYFERLYNLPTKDQLEAKIPRTKYQSVKPKASITSEPSTSADMPETDDTDGHRSENSGKYSCQSCRARKRGELVESGNDSEELVWDEGT